MLLPSHLSGFFLLTLIGGAEVFFEVVVNSVEVGNGVGVLGAVVVIMRDGVRAVSVMLDFRVLNRVVRGVFARVTKTVHVGLLMFRQVLLAG